MKHDYAHKQTNKKLEDLERHISAEYGKAAKELQEKIDDYFAKFEKRDAELKKKLDAGEITEDYYKQWRLAQIGRGKRFEALRDRIAERMTKANEVSAAYINDKTAGIYSLNRNYAAYTIEQVAGDIDFTLWDEQTVKRLVKEQPDLMPYYPPERAVKRGIDLKWGKKQITAQVTSGILQGESIKSLADRLNNNIPDMNRTSAIRAARTAVTGAQNAGRIESYAAAQKMGIDLMQEWVATLDGRTRHSHAAMDGEKIEPGKKFSNGCRYPGDPSGPSWEVYNCFVGETQIASDSGIVRSYKHEYDGELVEVKTSSGVNFTCTPNHPILTPGGWVAAARLNDGDDLLVTFSGDACTFRWYGNIEHIHSRMKALYNALHRFGLMSRDSTLRVDFHGDIPAKNVEIIAKEWVLRDNGDSGSGKRVNKFLLKDSDKTLMRKSAFVEHFWRVWKSAFCFIGGKCKALSLFRRGVSHADVHGFGAVSRRNVGVSKDAVNDLTAEAKTFCEVLDRFSGSIAADKVINVKIIPAGSATTHVYNLQTENGYYFVNSSIAQNKSKCNGIFAIAKNCRCTLIASLPDVDTSDAKRWARDPETGEAKLIEDMTYSEWAGWKEQSATYYKPISIHGMSADETEQINKYFKQLDNKYHARVDGVEDLVTHLQNEYDSYFEATVADRVTQFPRKKEKQIRKEVAEMMGPRPEAGSMQVAMYGGQFDPLTRILSINPENTYSTFAEDKEHRLNTRARWERRGRKEYNVFSNVPSSTIGTFLHEYGHAIDYQYSISTHPKFLKYYRQYTEQNIRWGLSDYATTNSGEFIAEAFCESFYDDQGEISKGFMKVLEEIINDKRK